LNGFTQIVDFTLVYNKYKTKIYNFTYKMTSDRETTEDILQEVFTKLYQNFDNIKNKNSIIYWLFRTARNLIYSYYAEKNLMKNLISLENDEGQTIEIETEENLVFEYEVKELKQLVQNALNEIPVEQKEVFLFKEYGELSYKEIADILNISEELVKGRLFKARQKLIKILSTKINR